MSNQLSGQKQIDEQEIGVRSRIYERKFQLMILSTTK